MVACAYERLAVATVLLSTVPTLWARRRAVIELGGGRLPHRSPLGGGRVAYEGAQQPQALELASISPYSHDLTAFSARLCAPRSTSQSRALATNCIRRIRIHPQAAAAAAAAALVRVAGPSGRQQRRLT